MADDAPKNPDDRAAGQSPYITFSERPELRDPVMIVAFEGWNDAAEAASSALEFLQETWAATRFAEIDHEEFYDFTESRPMVRLVNRTERRIDWPTNEFFYYRDQQGTHDYILLLGVEPQLKWRTFTRLLLDVARDAGVTTIISLGALLADVPHARPTRVSVSATDPTLRARLGHEAGRPSRYEGPTGIVGILQDACKQAGIAGASLWGHAPHYLSASPNPQVTLGILRRLDELLELGLDLHELVEEAEIFVAQVNEVVSNDPEATSYISQLEAHADDDTDDDDEGETYRRPFSGSSGGSGQNLIEDVEEFLRRRKRGKQD